MFTGTSAKKVLPSAFRPSSSETEPRSLSPSIVAPAATAKVRPGTATSWPAPPSGSAQSMLPEKIVSASSFIVEFGAVRCPPGSPGVGPAIWKVCPKSGRAMPLSVIADRVCQRSGVVAVLTAVWVKQPAVLNCDSLKVTVLTHGGGGGGGVDDPVALTLIVLLTVTVWAGLPPAPVSVIRTLTTCGPAVVNV